MTTISLFTPINYAGPRSYTEAVLSTLSNYFYLGGTRATVIKGNEVQLEPGTVSRTKIALKIASYVLLFPLAFTLLTINLAIRYQYHFSAISTNTNSRQATITINLKREPSTEPTKTDKASLPTSSQKRDLTTTRPTATITAQPVEQAPLEVMPNLKKTPVRFKGDLTPLQKASLYPYFIDEYTLAITFQDHPKIDFTIRRQDIFTGKAQIIINAANTHLGGGGGIDGAIHAKGGAKYASAHRELKRLYNPHYVEGHAAMIDSGDLKEKYNIENVIVVAGPQGAATPDKETELYSCYFNALVLADEQNKTSIAFPSISTGIFGFPKDRAAAISLKAINDFLDEHPNTLLKTISIHFLPNDAITNLEIFRAQIQSGNSSSEA